jgi:membrane-associated phospholipid phosphatase
MRGLGLPELFADLLGPFVVGFALLTQLGDVWLLSLLVGCCYWLGSHTPWVDIDRERAAIVVGLLLLYLVLIWTLKPLFGLPRPPGAAVPPRGDLIPPALAGVYEWLSTSSSYGFPSGHALGTTLVYGGLAWAIRTGSRTRRIGVAAGLVLAVSLSRVALGLHYLPDVLAGMALGVATLAVALRLGTPGRVFGLGAVVGVVGALLIGPVGTILGLSIAGPSIKLLASAGVAVGAALAWRGAGDELTVVPSRREARATLLVGGVVVAILGAGGLVARSLPPAAALLGLVGGVAIVAMPLLGERVAKKNSGSVGR